MPCSGPLSFPVLRKAASSAAASVERVRIERHKSVERRSALIVGRDPVEIALHELDAGQGLCPVGGVDLLDCRFFQGKLLLLAT